MLVPVYSDSTDGMRRLRRRNDQRYAAGKSVCTSHFLRKKTPFDERIYLFINLNYYLYHKFFFQILYFSFININIFRIIIYIIDFYKKIINL